jgi:hypothetical protein
LPFRLQLPINFNAGLTDNNHSSRFAPSLDVEDMSHNSLTKASYGKEQSLTRDSNVLMSSFIVICVNIPSIFTSYHLCKISIFFLHYVWNLMSDRHIARIHITIIALQPELNPSPQMNGINISIIQCDK